MAKMSAHGHATLCLIRKRQEPVSNQLCTRIVKYRFMSDGKVLRLAQTIFSIAGRITFQQAGKLLADIRKYQPCLSA